MKISQIIELRWITFGIALFPLILAAQFRPIEVDLNFDGRQEQEVHDPGSLSWIIGGGTSASFSASDITFTIMASGGYASSWYKAGAQNPYYARLVSDGVKSVDMELHITGLAEGKHSLVTYHNAFDNPETNTFAPIDILVNGQLVHENLEQSVRATSADAATSAFVEFEVSEGETVIIQFRGDANGGYTVPSAFLNGFKLDAPDASKQSSFPYPEDRDEHANADGGSIHLQWKAAPEAVSHNVYFGSDENAVFYANTTSPEFLGNQKDTSMLVEAPELDKYYWRIDEISASDTTRGDVWYFIPGRVAFNGAEGYGAYAIGGRGGKVVYVTNLNDSGPGSFRYAVEEETGPRTILFAVSGLITLESRLVIRDNYITVAGQSAPGKGVCFRWAPIGVVGNDLIVQHLRVRVGHGITYDGMGLTGAESSIIDHCSISWTIDEAFSSRGAKNITLQKTLISEALNAAGHSNYEPGKQHGFAASIGGDIGSFHHNLLAHCAGRNWSLAGGLDGNAYYAGRLDITNNVVYNWDGRTTDGGAHEVNFVNNYYKPGPAIENTVALTAQHENVGLGTQQYYFAGNVMPGYFDETNQEKGRDSQGSVDYQTFVDEPFFESRVTTQKAGDAFKIVLSDVGATQPMLDDHDIRMVTETRDGTTSLNGSVTNIPGLPDHEKDAGYWEEYPGFQRSSNWDSDLDGLPDWWENVIGTSSNSGQGDFSDSNADHDSDLFTNLEEYLEWMGNPHYFVEEADSVTIELALYSRGFSKSPSYTITAAENGDVTLANGVVTYKPEKPGFDTFSFTVTDAESSTMTREIGIFVGSIPESTEFGYSYYLDRDETVIVEVGEVEDTTTTVLGIGNPGELIWPNPANNQITVSNSNGIRQLTVYGISGNKVIQQEYLHPSTLVQVDISDLDEGIYVIHIVGESNSKKIKFLKN